MIHTFIVNDKEVSVDLDNNANYAYGAKEILIDKFGDLTRSKEWFDDGFKIEKSSCFYDSDELYTSTTRAIINILLELKIKRSLNNFSLENYHNFVDRNFHYEVIKRSGKLFPKDLDINVDKIVREFSNYFGTDLTFENPTTGETHWMQARIIKPKSDNFNTVHKDIYAWYDKYASIPRMVNIWIPLCGVNNKSSLPIVPKSHKIPENLIKRTKIGSTMNGKKYSVASIMEWDGSTKMITPVPNSDELIFFSSHLIHGLAVNSNEDTTRVAFEFRLYEKI